MNPGPHGPEPCALPNCASPRLECDSIGALPKTPIKQTCLNCAPDAKLILVGAAFRQEMGGGPVMSRTSVGGEFLVTWRRLRALRP